MKRTSIVLSFAVIAGLAMFPMRAYAATASISMVPSITGVTTNETVTITITENSGSEPVNAVQANLSYPADSLQYVSTTNNDTFKIDAQTAASNGTVELARGAFSPVTGSQPVAVLTFKALGSNGTADLSFASGTAIVSSTSNTNILGTETGTSLSLNAPANTSGTTDNGSDDSSSHAPSDPAPATGTDTTKSTQQPVATLVNTGTDLMSVLGIGSLTTAVGYIAALSYRKFARR